MSDPLLRLELSPARRWFGVAMTGGLALLLAAVLALEPPTAPWAVIGLIFFTIVAGWQAWRLHRAGERALLLHEDRLTDETGRILTTMDNVARIDRGVFAFKPSNGFVLILRERTEREAAPGLFWKRGRRIGVGGAAHAQTAKNMADAIQTMLAMRDEAP